MKVWKHWHYKNTSLLVLGLIAFFLFAEHPFVKSTIGFVGNFGYFGSFLAGIFFVSVFTLAPASVLLFFLAETLNPYYVALFAGLGAVLGDYLIFRFFKDRVLEEIEPIFLASGGKALIHLFKTPYFAWMLPVIGAAIIASPIPDEIGVGLLGVSKIKSWQFALLSFVLNSVGIFLVIGAAGFFGK